MADVGSTFESLLSALEDVDGWRDSGVEDTRQGQPGVSGRCEGGGAEEKVYAVLLNEEWTVRAAAQWRSVLIDVLRGLLTSMYNRVTKLSVRELRNVFVACSRILLVAPHVEGVVARHFSTHPPCLAQLLRSEQEHDSVSLEWRQQILAAALVYARDFPSICKRWRWSHVIHEFREEDAYVRWCAVRAVTTALRLSPRTRIVVESSILSQIESDSCTKRHSKMLRSVCSQRGVPAVQASTSDGEFDTFGEELIERLSHICSPSSGRGYSRLSGVEVTSRTCTGNTEVDSGAGRNSNIVWTKTMLTNEKNVAVGMCQAKPILVEGPPSSGKSMLLKHIAAETGNRDVVTLHLDDQTDYKSLLGTYVAGDVPGEFRWQGGALTRAVRDGHLLILEDINLAPAEMLSALPGLLESNTLFIPGQNETVKAAPGFRIFAIMTTYGYGNEVGKTGMVRGMLEDLWNRIWFLGPKDEDVEAIVAVLFPRLGGLASILIDKFYILSHSCGQNPFGRAVLAENESNGRLFRCAREYTLRDLLKWCSRIDAYFAENKIDFQDKGGVRDIRKYSSEIQRRCFMEGFDCLLSFLLQRKDRETAASFLASELSVQPTFCEEYITTGKPAMQVSSTAVTIGRSTITRRKENSRLYSRSRASSSVFAETGHSMRLMEQISMCVQHHEASLLVGETGCGKTSLLSHIANAAGVKFIVVNLSQQSDTADLVGGFKPVSSREICLPVLHKFNDLFLKTWSRESNSEFFMRLNRYAEKEKWSKLIHGIELTCVKAQALGSMVENKEDGERAKKRKRLISVEIGKLWSDLTATVAATKRKLEAAAAGKPLFGFVEGALISALREGHWLLLDEMNLAPPETLERLLSILEGRQGSITLTERGDIEPIPRHPDFRLFGAMNPATDVGKKDLPSVVRQRFTEMYMPDPEQRNDLCLLVSTYLKDITQAPIDDIVSFFFEAKRLADECLSDGADQRPHYSLRTLARAMEYTHQATPIYGMHRALYDGLSMTFLTCLQPTHADMLESLLRKIVLKNMSTAALSRHPNAPPSADYVLFDHFWLASGDREIQSLEDSRWRRYVLTPSINKNLRNIARAVLMRKQPILLQGPTSSGKTSLVEYLAAQTGHHFVRLNNHEHTELSEYIGSYIVDENGKLGFHEGPLVRAVRDGHWIVLDELNLAPTEVLEALNRLLDDNRELYVPELQESIRAHPRFVLFATQNPPGTYGGRKVLSKAFRNRFLELHIPDIPDCELGTILEKRCSIPKSFAERLVSVMRELMRLRQSSRAFAGRKGYITPRDLFRWADRHAVTQLELAENGYMILGERLRTPEERLVVQEVLEKVMKVKLDLADLYARSTADIRSKLSQLQGPTKIVWSSGMTRMYTLLSRCVEFKEPILLVGQTGCGKTTVCQLLADMGNHNLDILNCHRHTEASDFLGAFRPVRNRERLLADAREVASRLIAMAGLSHEHGGDSTFGEEGRTVERNMYHLVQIRDAVGAFLQTSDIEADCSEIRSTLSALEDLISKVDAPFCWEDGALLKAMRSGGLLLVDELSLADDSVLERLNSVLEPERSLVLAERGGNNVEVITAAESFRLMATMNPGGDFGKRELSPALRNRFTEVWVPSVESRDDLVPILFSRMQNSIADHEVRDDECTELCNRMIDFKEAFIQSHSTTAGTFLTLRDLLAWANFIRTMKCRGMSYGEAYVHGAFMIAVDSIRFHNIVDESSVDSMVATAKRILMTQLMEPTLKSPEVAPHDIVSQAEDPSQTKGRNVEQTSPTWSLGRFSLTVGPHKKEAKAYSLNAPSVAGNAARVVRAMQLQKPILLEGSPGVGKTSLIHAIAQASGHKLVRINLSEQTDMMDLLGSDLPNPDGGPASFKWADGIFLTALKAGDWILLDELNLANQTVLEGLNSVLDHRGEIYIPDIGQRFRCPASFRLFGAQNPVSEGGGRKGLPKSFLDRFSRVYIDPLQEQDLVSIVKDLYPQISKSIIADMVSFNILVDKASQGKVEDCSKSFARLGSPWEFNLRDVLRWCELIIFSSNTDSVPEVEIEQVHLGLAAKFVHMVYTLRFRSSDDREQLYNFWRRIFGFDLAVPEDPSVSIFDDSIVVGGAVLSRVSSSTIDCLPFNDMTPGSIWGEPTDLLESAAYCISRGYMCMLIGENSLQRQWAPRTLAHLSGKRLIEVTLTEATDTSDLLGGFEQVQQWQAIAKECEDALETLHYQIDDIISQGFESSRAECLLFLEDMKEAVADLIGASLESESESEMRRQGVISICTLLEEFDGKSLAFAPETLRTSLRCLSESLLAHNTMSSSSTTEFCWIDGPLVRALQKGDWILLNGANMCNASILDRLNSLLESGGTLVLNECGLGSGEVREIVPHADFRIFLSLDPAFGEVSRAMRNRGIELFVSRNHSDWPATGSEDWAGVNPIINRAITTKRSFDPALLLGVLELWKAVVAAGYHSGNIKTYKGFRTAFERSLEMIQQLHSRGLPVGQSLSFLLQEECNRWNINLPLEKIGEVIDSLGDHFGGTASSMPYHHIAEGFALMWPLNATVNSLASDVSISSYHYFGILDFVFAYIQLLDIERLNKGKSFPESALIHRICSSYEEDFSLSSAACYRLGVTGLKVALSDSLIGTPSGVMKNHIDMIASNNTGSEGMTSVSTHLLLEEFSSLLSTEMGGFIAHNGIEKSGCEILNRCGIGNVKAKSKGMTCNPLTWSNILPSTLSGQVASAIADNSSYDLFHKGPSANDGSSDFQAMLYPFELLALFRNGVVQTAEELMGWKCGSVDFRGQGKDVSVSVFGYCRSVDKKLKRVPHKYGAIADALYAWQEGLQSLLPQLVEGAIGLERGNMSRKLSKIHLARVFLWNLTRAKMSDMRVDHLCYAWSVFFEAFEVFRSGQALKFGEDFCIDTLRAALESMGKKFSRLGHALGCLEVSDDPLLWRAMRCAMSSELSIANLYARAENVCDLMRIGSLDYVDELTALGLETSISNTASTASLTSKLRDVAAEGLGLITVGALYQENMVAQVPVNQVSTADAQRLLGDVISGVKGQLKQSSEVRVTMPDGSSCPLDYLAAAEFLKSQGGSKHLRTLLPSSASTLPYVYHCQFQLLALEEYRSLGHSADALIDLGCYRGGALQDIPDVLKQAEMAMIDGILYSPRSPADFVWLKKLFFARSDISESFKVREMLCPLLHEGWYYWHRASFNTLLDRQTEEICHGGKSSTDVEVSKIWKLSSGPPRSFQSVVTTIACGILSDNVQIQHGPIKEIQYEAASNALRHPNESKGQCMRQEMKSIAFLLSEMVKVHLHRAEHGDQLSCTTQLIDDICNCVDSINKDAGGIFSRLIDGDLCVKHETFRRCCDAHIKQMLTLLCSEEPPDKLKVGHLWAHLGMTRLALASPPATGDPAAPYEAEFKQYGFCEDELKAEAWIRERKKCMPLQVPQSSHLKYIEMELRKLSLLKASSATKMIARPSPDQYASLRKDVYNMEVTLLCGERIEEMQQRLVKSDENALEEYLQWSLAIDAACERLPKDYPLFRDVTQLVSLAVSEIRRGLSLCVLGAFEVKYMPSASFHDAVVSLFAYNSEPALEDKSGANMLLDVKIVEDLERVSCHGGFAILRLKMKLCIVALRRLWRWSTCKNLLEDDDLERVHQIFKFITHAWNRARDACNDEDDTVLDEDIEDEKIFRESYPDFYKAFDDLESRLNGIEEEVKDLTATEKHQKNDSKQFMVFVERSILPEAVFWHRLLFSLGDDRSGGIANLFSLAHMRAEHELGVELYRAGCNIGPAEMDRMSRRGHNSRLLMERIIAGGDVDFALRMNSDLLVREFSSNANDNFNAAFGHIEESKQAPPPALDSSCIDTLTPGISACELLQLSVPVTKVRRRVGVILQELPENPLLVYLNSLCERLLSLTLDSTLRHATVGMELLLARAQSWEETSPKALRIGEILRDCTKLVLRWRAIELKSWPNLLHNVERTHLQSAGLTWTALYEVLTGGLDQEENSNQSFATSIEHFLGGANLGQFKERLLLLWQFYCQSSRESRTRDREGQQRLNNLILNSCLYFWQFVDKVESHIKETKRPIEKELQDFFRLAKWEERGYYSQKESVEKSQRTLHRLSRKYTEILVQPVLPIICPSSMPVSMDNLGITTTQNSRTSEEKGEAPPEYPLTFHRDMLTLFEAMWTPTVAAEPSNVEDFKYVGRCKTLTSRMQSLLKPLMFTREHDAIWHEGPSTMEAVINLIFLRIEALKSNSKATKAHKKIALSDLFKTLKRMGLSPLRSSVPPGDRDPLTWFETLTLGLEVVPGSASEKHHHQSPAAVYALPDAKKMSDDGSRSLNSTLVNIWHRGSRHFFRNMFRARKLAELVERPHPDISMVEAQNLTHYTEHIMFVQRLQRRGLATMGGNYEKLRNLCHVLDALTRDTTTASEEEIMNKLSLSTSRAHVWLKRQHISLATVSMSIQECLNVAFITSKAEAGIDMGLSKKLNDLKFDVDSRGKGLLNELRLLSKTEEELWCSPSDLIARLQSNYTWLSDQRRLLLNDFPNPKGTLAPLHATLSAIMGDASALEDEVSCLRDDQVSESISDKNVNKLSLEAFTSVVDETIEFILLACQKAHLAVHPPSESSEGEQSKEEGKEEDFSLLQGTQRIVEIAQPKRAMDICSRLEKILNASSLFSSEEALLARPLVHNLLPMVTMFAAYCEWTILHMTRLHKSTAKLGSLLVSLSCNIIQHGFCETRKEEDGAGAEDDKEGKFNEAGGTGMGEGEGKKDVSDQIENEDQILGTEHDEKEEEHEEAEPDADATGIEMQQVEEGLVVEKEEMEFEGSMHDIEPDEINEDEPPEDGDDQRIEQEMGDTGKEGEVVDEKLWGGEPPDPEKGSGEEMDDAPIKVDGDENLEYRGQEEEEEEERRDDKQEAAEKEKAEGKEGGEENNRDEQADNQAKEENKANDDGGARDEIEPEGRDDELPEEMNIDDDGLSGDEGESGEEKEGVTMRAEGKDQFEEEEREEEEKEVEPEMDNNADEMNNNEEEADDLGEGEKHEKVELDGKENDEEEEGEDKEMDLDNVIQDEHKHSEGEAGGNRSGAQQAEEEAPTKPEIKESVHDEEECNAKGEEEEEDKDDERNQRGQGSEPNQPDEEKSRPNQPPKSNTTAEAPQQQVIEDLLQQNQQEGEENTMDMQMMQTAGETGALARTDTRKGKDGNEEKNDDDTKAEAQQKRDDLGTDQKRSVGDALKEWQDRIDALDIPASKEEDGGNDEEKEQKAVGMEHEFVHNGEEEEDADMDQALAPATMEQALEMAKQEAGEKFQQNLENGEGEEEEGDAYHENQEEKSDPRVAKDVETTKNWPASKKNQKRMEKAENEVDGVAEEGKEEEEQEKQHDDAEMMDIDGEARLEASDGILIREEVEEEMEGIEETEEEMAIDKSENMIEVTEEARAIWAACESKTALLAAELTEQLRLVLEPTEATRLVGDFKTGKRLNMRRVIGFIASQFRKNKIWLRRNRPDKRQYQVLLAVDNSKSMEEAGCGTAALEATALLTKVVEEEEEEEKREEEETHLKSSSSQALSRLEVGQVGTIRFGGGGVRVLHAPETQFNGASGGNLVSQLKFDRDNTIADAPMRELLEALEKLTDAASASRGFGNKSQMQQLVLILADGRFHEKEGLQRRVRELSGKPGVLLCFIILDTGKQSIAEMQSVSFEGGKPVFIRYLDTFPFPYYIILRDMGSLPRTLADLMRQWFELTTDR